MKPILNNVMLHEESIKKSIIDGKKKLVIDEIGPDVTSQFKKGDRVYLDMATIGQELDGKIIVKESDIIAYEA